VLKRDKFCINTKTKKMSYDVLVPKFLEKIGFCLQHEKKLF